MASSPVVHIVEDDAAVRDALGVLLQTRGFSVRDYASAEALLEAGPCAGCVLTDVQMAEMDGLELLRRLKSTQPQLPVVVMTGRADPAMADHALKAGAAAFVEKPFAPEEVIEAVRRALDGAL